MMTPNSSLSPSRLSLAIIAGIIGAPIIAALSVAIGAETAPSPQTQRYIGGTAFLCVAVALIAGVTGAIAGALIALTRFPGRRLLAVLLAAPFAIPAYITAYAYGDVFGPFGPVANIIGVAALPEIRSAPGAAIVLSLATYPYVYLAVAASLSARSGALIDAARMLGARPSAAVSRILIAAGRPAFVGGLALALMETIGDFGVADYFGVPTLSVGIFRTWYGLGDLQAATQIAAILFFVALLFVLFEEAGRRGRAADPVRNSQSKAAINLSVRDGIIAVVFLSLPVIFGFIIPVAVFLNYIDLNLSASAAYGLFASVQNTSLAAAGGALLATGLALALGYAGRSAKSRASAIALRVATLGYAVPGAVIAIGVLALTAALSQWIGAGAAGGFAVLIYAYAARFLTVAYNGIVGGLAQISPDMDAAARSLGASPSQLATRIHWPAAQGAVLVGAGIVAIDIAKELPATLLLRPFNFETLATRIYRLASDERLADAAPAALLLITISLIPLIFITRALLTEKSGGPSR